MWEELLEYGQLIVCYDEFDDGGEENHTNGQYQGDCASWLVAV